MTTKEMDRRIRMVQQAYNAGIIDKYAALNEIKSIEQEFLKSAQEPVSLQEFVTHWTVK